MQTIVSQIKDRRTFFKGTDTMDVGYPWLTFGAIMTLESIVNKDMKVLEFGSGGSTVFFAKNCGYVESFETDENWFETVYERLRDYSNIRLVLGTEKENIELLKDIHVDYDIILVDSGWVRDETGKHSPQRGLIAKLAIEKLKVGGYLILDNYEHYGLKDVDLSRFEVYTFDDIGYSGRGTKICKKLR